MTDRIKKRLDALFEMDNDEFFFERTLLLEEAYSLYEHEECGRRYAHAFAYLLDHMTIVIQPDELIVGSVKEQRTTAEQEEWYMQLTEKPENNNNVMWGVSFESLGILGSPSEKGRYSPEWFSGYGHNTYDLASVLTCGIGGIRCQMQHRLANDVLTDVQRQFYENGLIVCDAFKRYAKRTADHARGMAMAEADPHRKVELNKIAENFDHVPMLPARSFYEALQSLWCIHLIESTICGARDYSFGRADQYLYPFYKHDIDAGILTREQAIELIESFYIKCNDMIGYCVYFYKSKRSLCNHSVQYLYLSGTDDEGRDATNELSFLMLEAHEDLKIQQPTLYVHYHKNINKAFLRRAVEVTKQGRGDPAYFNDETVIEALMNTGAVDYEDARHFSHCGCNNLNFDAQSDEVREIWDMMPKFLELAINSGHDMQNGKLLTYEGRPAEELKNIDDVYNELIAHYGFNLAKAVQLVAKADAVIKKNKTFSVESLLVPYCLENGVDLTSDTKYRNCNVYACGLVTVGDSLYTIDRLVFQEKRFTLPELRNILKNNWEGHELLRLEIKSKFPKFGNDIDEVDAYTVRLAQLVCDEMKKHSPVPGGKRILLPGFYSQIHATEMGLVTAASADGRRNGEPINENQSPTYGCDRSGPTAMLNSLSKMPFKYTPGGGLNVQFQPRFLEGEKGTENLMNLMEGYFDRGGLHMQIMARDKKELEDALVHPEEHRNLLVRVTGYSAYFVTLSPELQQEVISRTEQG